MLEIGVVGAIILVIVRETFAIIKTQPQQLELLKQLKGILDTFQISLDTVNEKLTYLCKEKEEINNVTDKEPIEIS